MIKALRANGTSWWRVACALPVAAVLSACAPTTEQAITTPPPGRVATGVMPAMPQFASPSVESAAARRFYARVERDQVAQGLMRIDGGGPDVPYTAIDLQRNFERVALFNEYVQVGGRFIPKQSAAQLRRWETPVRIKVHFGASLPGAQQNRDAAVIQRYVTRLARVTRHPISITNDAKRANYHIFVVSIDEQRALAPLIRAVQPKLSDGTVNEMVNLPRNNFCAVYASSTRAAPFVYASAIAIVRTEHSPLMRDACYHEEIAQGLGLANDSPAARPSIFNDDEEFAFLTTHDEQLLSMLYDPRLRPGMTPTQARPIVARLARERAPGGPA